MNPTPENLAQIRVLYRQPDTLALWGIPYDMRADVGQQPRDIERAREENNDGLYRKNWARTLPRPTYQDPHEGWVWLGQPGWWGSYEAGSPERVAVEAFLAELPPDVIPQGPCEWTKVGDQPESESCGVLRRAASRSPREAREGTLVREGDKTWIEPPEGGK